MKKSWVDFIKDIDKRVEMMKSYRPDIIVPSMNGGLVPAGILAEKLNIKDVRPVSIDRIGDKRKIAYEIQGDVKGKKILLLEDDLPTGKGFIYLRSILEKSGAEVRIAAVYVNYKSKKVADFYGEELDILPDLPWKPARTGDRVTSS
jgi:hypoxanthine phosphoribosyltransferase